MKKYLEKQAVFNCTLKILYWLSKWRVTRGFITIITNILAQFNLVLNRPKKNSDINELAQTWKKLMPPDGQDYYKITEVTETTAYAEIHLHCPLRGTDDVDACYKFMNYDRTLMKKVGASLTVLESQSNSNKNYCKLAIRNFQRTTEDLIPAHKK